MAGRRQRYRWFSLDPRDMASLLLTFGRVRDESPGKVGGMREGANHEFVQVYPKRAHTHIHAARRPGVAAHSLQKIMGIQTL